MSFKRNIAYVDDSLDNLECIQHLFAPEFDVDIFLGAREFLNDYETSSYSCILTDIHMPGVDGFELYEKIIAHPNYNGCPVLFISSDDSENARIKSLTLGAVDFISRLTNADELIARVKSRIQFFRSHRSIVEFDQLKVNLTLLKAYLNGEEVPLTFIEFKLLWLVIKNYPDTVSKETLVQQIWRGAHVLDATIHTHIFNLNSKLEAWVYEVLAVKGKGVQLQKRGESP
jgi:DNA-binding response OmpR family regulator